LDIAHNTFKQFDKDSNGSLSPDEIKNVLTSLRQDPNSPAFSRCFEKDKNKDNLISFDEFYEIITDIPPPTQTEQWKAFFNLLDFDKNGKITLPELLMVLKELEMDFYDEDVEQMFVDIDINGDGTLSLSELQNYILQKF